MRKVLLILEVMLIITALTVFKLSAYPSRRFVINSVAWSRLPSGESGVAILRLEVAYYGGESLLDVEAKLSLECDAKVLSPDVITVGSWEPGTVKVLTFLINTSNIYGEYTATLEINYDYIARKRTMVGYEIIKVKEENSLSFKLSFYGNPFISVFVSPNTVVKDSTNTLTITIKNTGTGDALDLSVIISFSGAALLEVEQPLRVRVSKLSPNRSIKVRVTLVPFSPQVSMNIRTDYVDSYGNRRVDQVNIIIPSFTGVAIVVLAKPSKVKAGSLNEISLEVKNIGDSILKDVFMQIQVTQGSQIVIEPQFLEIGEIAPRKTKRCNVSISAPNLAIGAQNIAYILTYKNEQGSRITVKGSLNIFIVEQAQLTITAVEIVPSKPKVNETVIISLTLINLGSKALNKVNVTIESLHGLEPLRKTYYFLGQIQPQTPTSIPFSFKALEVGKQTIKFKVTCEDMYGIKWSTTKFIEIEVLKAESSSSGEGVSKGFMNKIIVIIIIVTVLITVMLYIRKKRKR